MSIVDTAEGKRRDFHYIATGAVGAFGAALAARPAVRQMNPDDTGGRIRQLPAPENLHLPKYNDSSATRVQTG